MSRQIAHASPLYGTFAIVLGLIAWLYLQAQLTLYAVEINVVLAYRLWPRSLAPPLGTAAGHPLDGAARLGGCYLLDGRRRGPAGDLILAGATAALTSAKIAPCKIAASRISPRHPRS